MWIFFGDEIIFLVKVEEEVKIRLYFCKLKCLKVFGIKDRNNWCFFFVKGICCKYDVIILFLLK